MQTITNICLRKNKSKQSYVWIDSIFEAQSICFGTEEAGLLDFSYNKCALKTVKNCPCQIVVDPMQKSRNITAFPCLLHHSSHEIFIKQKTQTTNINFCKAGKMENKRIQLGFEKQSSVH